MENTKVLVPGTSSKGDHGYLFLEQVVRESMENTKVLVPGTSSEGDHGTCEGTCSWNKQ
jgi:hypothetical protein